MRTLSSRPIRVLIVSADAELGKVLGEALAPPGFVIAGVVAEATSATRACLGVRPDIAVVDAGLPAHQGFAAIQDIMAFRPTPILVLTGATVGPEAFEALALGALDVIGRPVSPGPAFTRELAQRLRLLAGVRVIQHVGGRRRRRPPGNGGEGRPIVGVAASLGGPRALAVLLKGLPNHLAAPICIVQHISDGFVQGLTEWLAAESGLPVHEAKDGEVLAPGEVVVAPSGAHLLIGEGGTAVLDPSPPIEGFRPSATHLFGSLAQRCGARAVGVVLTGMGRDGADGLKAIRDAGGHTLAQDEASSAVYGMPKAAVEAGAVDRVVGIDGLASVLAELVHELATAAEAR